MAIGFPIPSASARVCPAALQRHAKVEHLDGGAVDREGEDLEHEFAGDRPLEAACEHTTHSRGNQSDRQYGEAEEYATALEDDVDEEELNSQCETAGCPVEGPEEGGECVAVEVLFGCRP